jgi:filamentous hemagglutinin family protein
MVLAQIVPANDGTGTLVAPVGNQIDIYGGALSADGANLFHSFEQLNLAVDQTANFLSDPQVQNILGRIVGGDPALINGLLQITGSQANLYLINPAGILLGADARLNLPAAFTATTADGVGFADGWFQASGENTYSVLQGSPEGFAFLEGDAGAVVNLGDLAVAEGQSLTLLGKTVVNGGTLTAPGGQVTVAAVPGEASLVRISQAGSLLNLEVALTGAETEKSSLTDLTPSQFASYLIGGEVAPASALMIGPDGTVRLTGSDLSLSSGVAIATGTLSTQGETGGNVNVLGQQVILAEALVDASGNNGGGTIRIGGDYQGQGPVPNALQTIVSPGTTLSANAATQGNGGQIIVWADGSSRFSGRANAQGGTLQGDGGFIEISGKTSLSFDGAFDVSATQGSFGTVLFDPDNIEIINGSGVGNGDPLLPVVIADDNDGGWFTIHEGSLEFWNGNANIFLQANQDIVIRNLGGDDTLAFQPGSGSITFIADADGDGTGRFLMERSGDLIRTAGRDITISAQRIDLEFLDTRPLLPGLAGAVTLTAPGGIVINRSLDAGAISFKTDALDFRGGANSLSGLSLLIETADPARNINLGSNTNVNGSLNLLDSDLTALSNNFSSIAIGRADGTGTITLNNSLANGGSNPFQDPVTILGAGTLMGPNQTTPWVITGANQGNLNSLFSNGLTFANVGAIVGSSSATDSIAGTNAADSINIKGPAAGSFNGISFSAIENVDAQGGNDTLSGSAGDDSFSITGINQITTNGVTVSSVEILDGQAGNDTVAGTTAADIISITGPNTGTVNGIGFNNVEAVDAQGGNDALAGTAGDDIFTITGANQVTTNGVVVSSVETLDGQTGTDTVVGTAAADAISVTGANAGTVNGIGFANVEAVDGQTGNDTLAGTAGDDTFTLTGANQVTTSGVVVASVEAADGQTGTDTVVGTVGADAINVTGTNAGIINGMNFAGVENLAGNAGDDTFSFTNGASVSGLVDGGGGSDRLDYRAYTTAVSLDLGSNTATGVGSFNNIESVTGGSSSDTLSGTAGSDSFTLTAPNAGTVNGISFAQFEILNGQAGNDSFVLTGGSVTTILGGANLDSLAADNVSNTWNITGPDRGTINGIAFSQVENLQGGNQTDAFSFVAADAQVSGAIDGAAGNLILTGDQLDWGNKLAGTGSLLLQPVTPNRAIVLGGVGSSPNALNLTAAELGAIQNGFSTITLGNGSGPMTLAGNTVFQDAVVLRSQTFQAQGFSLTGVDNAGFDLQAAQTITTADIRTQGGPIALTSASGNITTGALDTRNPGGIGGSLTLNSPLGAIATGNLNTSSLTTGGDVRVTAGSQMTLADIDTRAATGAAGSVALSASGDIQIGAINAAGGSQGGAVTAIAGTFFRATDTFATANGLSASISTIGDQGGAILIQHGGNSITPFEVGRAGTLNGTAGVIASREIILTPGQSLLNSLRQGNISLLTLDRPLEPAPLRPTPVPPAIAIPLIESKPGLTVALTSNSEDTAALFEQLETGMTGDFEAYLNQSGGQPVASLPQVRTTLHQVRNRLGVKPALVYMYFMPDISAPEADAAAAGQRRDDDQLELLLVTAEGEPIRQRVWGVNRALVEQLAAQFRQQVTSPFSTAQDHLPPAQQLYQWLIAPLQPDLQRRGIQSLGLVMDNGLRSLPMAALHDGQRFLVENYSLGLLPTFSLTDFSLANALYENIDNTQVLAMGASEFQGEAPLPAVTAEVSLVAQDLWSGQSFLNQDFTLKNLQAQLQSQQYGVIHLATHAVFQPGNPENSYIQLWDQSLPLDQIPQLHLKDADVALVVLSACNTALGDEQAEFGFAGFAVNAGSQSALASLWPVSDEGTLGFMTEFYQHLHRRPIRAEALRQAQIAMLQGQLRIDNGRLYGPNDTPIQLIPELAETGYWDFAHPAYWSAFTMVGSPW